MATFVSDNGGGNGPSDIARKLRESQERQSQILKKIADKERRMEMGAGPHTGTPGATAGAAAAPHLNSSSAFANSLSSASLPYYPSVAQALNASSSSGQQQPAHSFQPHPTPHSTQHTPHQQYQQQQSYHSQSQAAYANSNQQQHHQQAAAPRPSFFSGLDFLNSSGGGAGSTTPLGGLDFTLPDERLAHTFGGGPGSGGTGSTGNLCDDESAMMRVRQLASQLRHVRSEGARKDIALANLQQQVAELSRAQAEHAANRAGWEAREQQHALRDQEYAQTVAELQSSVQSLTSTESTLRASNLALHKEKLVLERNSALQLGDMEARLSSLENELHTARSEAQQGAYETSVAQRELQRVQQAFVAFETTQLQMNQAMETKYFDLKREATAAAEEKHSLHEALARAQQQLAEKDEALEARDNELSIHARSKTSQAALVESLTRELAETQSERDILRLQVDSIPALKGQVADLAEVRAQLRAVEARNDGLQSALGQANRQAEVVAAENATLRQLQAELERSLNDSRERLATLTGPAGELEALRARVQSLQDEVRSAHAAADGSSGMVAETRASVAALEGQLESYNAFATCLLNGVHQLLEAGLTGASPAAREAIERDLSASMGAHVPSSVKGAVHGAASNLRAAVGAVLGEVAHLRTQQTGLLSQVESLSSELGERGAVLAELETQLQSRSSQFQSEGESWSREQSAMHQALERIGSELQSQREDNAKLNVQNTSLISDLDDRTLVIRLWAVELDNVARSLVSASAAANAAAAVTNEDGAQSQGLSARAELDEGRSVLGAAAPLSVSEHWPSIRSAFNDVVQNVMQRSRGLLSELSDCNRARAQQRRDVVRLSDELTAMSAQLATSMEASKTAAIAASQALESSESLRHSELTRLEQEYRDRGAEVQDRYERLVSDLQDSCQRNTNEVIGLTRQGHNLLTGCRILYKALRPLQLRVDELTTQKAVLNNLYQTGLRQQQEVRELMIAMTGHTNAPTGVRLLPRAARSLFRSGVLAVLAFGRLARGGRRGHPRSFGHLVQVRGEQFALLDNSQLSNDSNVPALDDSTGSLCAQSLVHLLAHFEPSAGGAEGARPRRSLLASLAAPVRFAPSNSGAAGAAEDHSPIASIRRVALALATRNKALERDLAVGSTDAWAAKEEARTLVADLQATHTQLAKLAQDSLDHERRRVATLEAEFQAQAATLRQVEEQLAAVTALKNSMISSQEYEVVRASRDEYARTARELESKLSAQSHAAASEREKSALQHQTALEERDSKLAGFQRRMHEMTEENQELQLHLRRKSAELASLERALQQGGDAHAAALAQLSSTSDRHASLVDRIQTLEGELGQHRLFSAQMQSQVAQLEALRQGHEATLAQAASEMREKERELAKSQELIRTLTAATRAATNELDSQLQYSSRQAARRGGPMPSATPQYHPHHASAHPSPAVAPLARSYAPSSAATLPLSSPTGGMDAQSAPSLQEHQGQSTAAIRLRHHPGGRLSMDVSRAVVTAAGLVPDHYADDVAPLQLHSHHTTALRFDELPAVSASAPPSAFLQRDDASRLQASPDATTEARSSSPAERQRAH